MIIIKKAVIAVISVFLLILSGNVNAYAPVSANLPHPGIAGFDRKFPAEDAPQVVIDGISVDLTKFFNSEIPLFKSSELDSGTAEVHPGEKRVHIGINNAAISFQFLNGTLRETASSFALEYSGGSHGALVITAPRIQLDHETVVEVTTTGQGRQRMCFLLDLYHEKGKISIRDMRPVTFPGKRADNLFVVNGNNLLEETYIPENLISIPKTVPAYQSKRDMKLTGEAGVTLEKMLVQAKKEGVSGFILSSTYRPYSYQKMLFDNKTKQVGSRLKAAQIVARPGTSEHQTGLAVDFSVNGRLADGFAETLQGKWLGENAWKYGFILRYPADKTDITEIIYEPWHFRYVGYPCSKIINDRKLCLEEFRQNLEQFGYYAVGDKNNVYLVVIDPGDNEIYLSGPIPKA